MPRPEDVVSIECEIIGDTAKALHIKTIDGEWWVPKSVITNWEDLPDEGHVDAHIQRWFVEKEEITDG